MTFVRFCGIIEHIERMVLFLKRYRAKIKVVKEYEVEFDDISLDFAKDTAMSFDEESSTEIHRETELLSIEEI